jgi:hypothetical protein
VARVALGGGGRVVWELGWKRRSVFAIGTWPSPRLDDLVLTLMLAIMTDQQQHTMLTRFVPVVLGDVGLDAKIQSILADVDVVLPTAAARLADEPAQTS